MLNADFYNLTQSLWGTFAQAMGVVRARDTAAVQPPPVIFQLRGGRAESPGWFLVQAAEFDPEPLTVANLRVRDIYASEGIVFAMLELMASEGWLDRQGNVYHWADAGREQWVKIQQRRVGWLAGVEELLPFDLRRIESLLGQVITASTASQSPPGVWCLAHSRNRAPEDAGLMSAKLFQYVADFNAFRDDAHMAAWQPLGVNGRSWEAFTFVGGRNGATAVAVFNQLAYRGYSRSDYAGALEELAARGWLETSNSEQYHITEQGNSIRKKVERLTDQYFYAPWSTLKEVEILEIQEQINQLNNALQTIE